MMHHRRNNQRRRSWRILTAGIAIIAVAAIAVAVRLDRKSVDPRGPLPVHLPATPDSYLGVFATGAPDSYAGVASFASATGTKPDVVAYYSGWFEPFKVGFATTAADDGAVPLVQMDPTGVSVTGIASGRYDAYLYSYAETVRAYHHPVILSFGHEMNGDWYSWGYRHTSPAVFVAAWRHIVKLFRVLGARNVTWLWTVNVISDTQSGSIPRPAQWWPGNSYVTWVGIDGYYLKSSWKFAPLFGPTIAAVRALTRAPILVAETAAVPAAGEPAKIADLFAGIRLYGLLGFVWFNSTTKTQDFRVSSSAATAAFRQGTSAYTRPGS
jgi:mannan endo-1,4-beta-mannosidase